MLQKPKGKRPMLFELNKLEAIDIDDEVDFEIAQQLFMIGNS